MSAPSRWRRVAVVATLVSGLLVGVAVAADGIGGDLGYPSTVELGDGELRTVWYERMADSPKAVLRQASWSLAPA